MDQISFEDFQKVELRVGKIISAEAFPEARKPPTFLKFGLDDGEHFPWRDQWGSLRSRARLINDRPGAKCREMN